MINISPILLAGAALFWGVEHSRILLGVVLALVLGTVTVIKRRWLFSENDFVRISDLTSVCFLTCIGLVMINSEMVHFLKELTGWLPLTLAPLIVAQLYSDSEKIVIGTGISLRKNRIHKHKPLDFRFYYFGLCLFSAAVANTRSDFFYPVVMFLLLWLLVQNRGRAFTPLLFATLFFVAAGMGVYGYKSSELLHDFIRKESRRYFYNYFTQHYADPFQSHLSFGNIGRLKLSDEIILRVSSGKDSPELLRQAVYETYHHNSWHSSLPFNYLVVSPSGWDLIPPPHQGGEKTTIEYYLPKEKGLLPQPYGSFHVQSPTIYELDQKENGITRIIDGASLISYDIRYRQNVNQRDQPIKKHLQLHRDEEPVVAKVASSLDFNNKNSAQRLAVIEQFFGDGFVYSLELVGKGQYRTVLENFLLESKRGYCEQYATAATLLLRKAGIPSRYVTGFAVIERSELEDKYLVRKRHAHAWSEAYIDGSWQVVDVTPSDWLVQESTTQSFFKHAKDYLAYFKVKFDHFRIGTEQNYKVLLSGVIMLLSSYLAYRIYRRMNARKSHQPSVENRRKFAAVDSPFYRIEEQLQHQITRKPQEQFSSWIGRIYPGDPSVTKELTALYATHLLLRFDPMGLPDKDLETYTRRVSRWLEKNGE